jgi:hypothetical protein
LYFLHLCTLSAATGACVIHTQHDIAVLLISLKKRAGLITLKLPLWGLSSVENKSQPGSPGPTLLNPGLHLSIVAGKVVILIFNLFYISYGK